jgi:hypothetical protein
MPNYDHNSLDEDFYEDTSPKRPREPENIKIQRERGDSSIIEKSCL